MKKLIILGAGGLGREAAWMVQRINSRSHEWELAGFLDENSDIWGNTVPGNAAPGSSAPGYPVLGGLDEAAKHPDAFYVCAVGVARARRSVIERLKTILPRPLFATLVDPSVIISPSVAVGEGSMIFMSCVLTVNIDVGRHTLIDYDCTIGHDSVLGDFVTLYPSVNVSGGCNIGDCAEMGVGSVIIQGLSVGECSIVGAGGVVVRDLPSNCTAVGAPAKPIKFN